MTAGTEHERPLHASGNWLLTCFSHSPAWLQLAAVTIHIKAQVHNVVLQILVCLTDTCVLHCWHNTCVLLLSCRVS
jgi:hypothetical protein